MGATIMSRINCLNCGAPFDTDAEKCPYCGTSYFDMSAIEIDGAPFILKIKININGELAYVTQLVRALPSVDIKCESDTVDYYGNGEKICSFTCGNSVTTNLQFQAVTRKNGNLIEVKKME